MGKLLPMILGTWREWRRKFVVHQFHVDVMPLRLALVPRGICSPNDNANDDVRLVFVSRPMAKRTAGDLIADQRRPTVALEAMVLLDYRTVAMHDMSRALTLFASHADEDGDDVPDGPN